MAIPISLYLGDSPLPLPELLPLSLYTASLRIIACRVLRIPVQAQCQHKVSRKQLFFSAAMMEEEEVLHVAGKLVFANNRIQWKSVVPAIHSSQLEFLFR